MFATDDRIFATIVSVACIGWWIGFVCMAPSWNARPGTIFISTVVALTFAFIPYVKGRYDAPDIRIR